VTSIVVLVFISTGVASADDTSVPRKRVNLREALRTFAADGRYLVTFPARTSSRGVWWTAGFVAATGLTMNRDDELRAEVLESDHRGPARIARKFEPLGRHQVEIAGLGAFYLAGRAARREDATSTAAIAFESYLWSAIVTSLSKGALGREGPDEGSGDGRFFKGRTAFPSGHTTRSFAVATVFADRYGRKGAFIAYPVAALVGLSTIQEDLHWSSDVVAGAGLGLAIGRGIAHRHRVTASSPAPGIAWTVTGLPGGAALEVTF
jgi:membrane-associated phospholipid phosphatase